MHKLALVGATILGGGCDTIKGERQRRDEQRRTDEKLLHGVPPPFMTSATPATLPGVAGLPISATALS